MNSFPVSSTDIQNQYKEIIERVRQTQSRAILMNRNEPQAVIISLEEAERFDELRRRNSGQALLDLAHEVREILKDEHLPSDLAARHDYYLWEEETPST